MNRVLILLLLLLCAGCSQVARQEVPSPTVTATVTPSIAPTIAPTAAPTVTMTVTPTVAPIPAVSQTTQVTPTPDVSPPPTPQQTPATPPPKTSPVPTVSPSPTPEVAAVTVAIIGPDKVDIGSTTVSFTEDMTALAALQVACDELGLVAEVRGKGRFSYLVSIGDYKEFANGAQSGWVYKVNGTVVSTGIGMTKLQEGDALEFCYTLTLGEDV